MAKRGGIGAGRLFRRAWRSPWPPSMCWSSGMVSSPTRRVSCPSRWRSLVCKIPISLLGLSETNTIGYYRCYEGNVTDVVALGASLQEMVGQFLPQTISPRLTLVLDKGNVSRDNFKALTKAHFSFLAAIPANWVRHLYQVSLKEYHPLALPDGRQIKVSRQPTKRLADIQGQLLVSFSPRFFRTQ